MHHVQCVADRRAHKIVEEQRIHGCGRHVEAVVEEFYAAMAAKNLQRLQEALAPDVVVTQDERLPWGGRYVGHDGFVEFALKLIGLIDSSVTILAIFEADDSVVQFGHTRGTTQASGTAFDIAEVHRWVIVDGRATEAYFAIDTAAMLTALAGDPPVDG